MSLNAKFIIIIIVLLLVFFLFLSPLSAQEKRENEYEEFASEAQQKNVRTQIVCAKKKGDKFMYEEGGIG